MADNKTKLQALLSAAFLMGQQQRVGGLDEVNGLDIVGSDGVVGADVVGIDAPSSGNLTLPRDASTLKPISAKVADGAALDANVLYADDLYFPTLTSTYTAGSPPTVATVQTAPSWLFSTYAQYKVALVYFARNPALCVGTNIVSSESGSAPLLASMQIAQMEINPFGRRNTNEFQVQSYLLPSQLVQNRAIVPLLYTLDLQHWFEVTTGTNTSGAQQTFAFSLAITKRFEGWRKVVPGAASAGINPNMGGADRAAPFSRIGAPTIEKVADVARRLQLGA